MHPVNFFGDLMWVISDERIDKASADALAALGFEPILMPAAKYLQTGVASHPDMLIFAGLGRLFCHEKYYRENRELIGRIALVSHLDISVSDEPTGEKYPLDVLFNACLVGDRLICNERTVSRLILGAAEDSGVEIINVPQGYTKCSVCAVSDDAIITADRAIAKICAAHGIDALTVSEGHVSLPPYSHGFIGGASGIYGDTVYFCGSLDTHPDGDRIAEFCRKHKKTAVSLRDGELYDVGTMFFI